MIKVLRSRQWTFVGVSVVILLFIGLIVYGAQNYLKLDTTISRAVSNRSSIPSTNSAKSSRRTA